MSATNLIFWETKYSQHKFFLLAQITSNENGEFEWINLKYGEIKGNKYLVNIQFFLKFQWILASLEVGTIWHEWEVNKISSILTY